MNRPEARIEPRETLPGSPENLRVRFALGVRREVAARQRARRVLGFDDLLTRLRDALGDAVAGPVACERLRRRYSVVLVDEFQDTDAVQWDVLRTAFHGRVPLVLIGDPKQAVYAFRGADVRSYLDAAGVAGTTATLATNHRSDPLVLAGTAALLRGAALGEPRIVVRPVVPAHAAAALVDAAGAHDPSPVRLRVLGRDGLPATGRGLPPVADVRAAVARDTAAQVVQVLREGLRVRPRRGGERDLAAGDVAVLVRTGAQAALVQEELRRRGVPCVLSRGPSVFATPAAQEWISLLEAVEQPHRAPRVRRVALSSFVGRSAAELDAAGDRATDDLSVQLREWGALLAERGVACAFALVLETHRLPERLLGVEGGERRLTDLRHIAEVLHAGVHAEPRGRGVEPARRGCAPASRTPPATSTRNAPGGWTPTARPCRSPPSTPARAWSSRWSACPFGWDAPGGGTKDRLPVAHAPDGPRALHVGGPGAPGYAAACRAADTEDLGEELRLLYVALTRAVSRLLVWWAPSHEHRAGRAAPAAAGRRPAGRAETVPVPADAAAALAAGPAVPGRGAGGGGDRAAAGPRGPPARGRRCPSPTSPSPGSEPSWTSAGGAPPTAA